VTVGKSDLCAGDRLQPPGSRATGELHRTVQAIVVGQGKRLVPELAGAEHNLVDLRCAFKEREVGMGVEFGVGRHSPRYRTSVLLVNDVMSRLNQLPNRLYNAIRTDARAFRQPHARTIYPDAESSKRLRSAHIELQVVSNGPCSRRLSAKRGKERLIDFPVRLAEAELPFHDNPLEVRLEAKAIDLRALTGGASVGGHPEADPLGPKPLDRFDSSGEENKTFFSQVTITVGDLGSSSRSVIAHHAERLFDDQSAGRAQVQPAFSMADRVRPVPVAPFLDRLMKCTRVQALDSERGLMAGLFPAGIHATAVIDDGVVEVENDSFRKLYQEGYLSEAPGLSESISLLKPTPGSKRLVYVNRSPIFQQQPVVDARNRAVAPPFVVDPPAFENRFDGKTAAGKVHHAGFPRVGVRVQAYAARVVERDGLLGS
jgi:hypothetical protein